MKNDVDYSVIKLFNFENNQIDNQRNYYSEMNFVQNITLIKDKIILKTKLPKSKPQVYEIMN
jgi:cysteinyl-tRNA synthetase